MNTLVKRSIAAVFGAAVLGAATVVAAAPASAIPLGCTATPVLGTAAFSSCGTDGFHRIHITCWNWWGTGSGSSGGFYERWGNPAFGQQLSISSCDVPFSLRSWDITY